MGCQSCNTSERSMCSNCNKCNICIDCQKCNSCQATGADQCETIQTLCIVRSEYLRTYAGTFAFSYRPTKDAGIMGPGYFDKSVWDEICAWISQERSVGEKSPGGPGLRSSYTNDVSPFTAAEYNRVANHLGIYNNEVRPNALIKGSYFTDLESAANVYKISDSACDICNVECDADGCDSCLTPHSCDACVTCTTGCNACNSCNTSQRRDCETESSTPTTT